MVYSRFTWYREGGTVSFVKIARTKMSKSRVLFLPYIDSEDKNSNHLVSISIKGT